MSTSRYVGTHLTWFLGSGNRYRWIDPEGRTWHDGGAEGGSEGAFASGLPYNTPGIALPLRSTLRWWCRVSMPRQSIVAVVRHVDIGPHLPVLDCTAPFAYMMFKSQSNIPDYTPWVVDPLGPELPEGVTANLTDLRTGSVTQIPDTI